MTRVADAAVPSTYAATPHDRPGCNGPSPKPVGGKRRGPFAWLPRSLPGPLHGARGNRTIALGVGNAGALHRCYAHQPILNPGMLDKALRFLLVRDVI